MARANVTRFLLATCFAAGCAGSTASSKASVQVAPGEVGEGEAKILVLMPFDADSNEVLEAIRSEIDGEFDVLAREVTGKTPVSELEQMIEEVGPNALVLMNNPTVRLYGQYQKSKGEGASFPPAVVLLSSFAEDAAAGLTHTTGITYEIPGVTLFVNLRSILSKELSSVGVVYREGFDGFVEKQRELMSIEKLELKGAKVRARPSARDIRLAVRSLRDQGVGAVWILNDNGILREELIVDGWLPAIQKDTLPVVVGVRALVNDAVAFGSFGVLPDHTAMGVQAANLLFELAESDWEMEDRGFDLPLSVKTVVDAKQAPVVGFAEGFQAKVDVVVKPAEAE